MQRTAIAAALILVSITFIIISVFLGDKIGGWGDVLGGLGTEITGIALTVAIVDWLLERKKLREEVVRLSWKMLHEIDQAVFVFQGGRREFQLDELAALLNMVEPGDKITPEAQELMVSVGVKASDAVRLQDKLLAFDRRLAASLRALTGLAQLRELKGIATNEFVVDALTQGLHGLSAVTGNQIQEGSGLNVARTFRDASEAAQKRRYRGAQQEAVRQALQGAPDMMGEGEADAVLGG